MSDYKTFGLTGRGFTGDTTAGDRLVKWIKARSVDDIVRFLDTHGLRNQFEDPYWMGAPDNSYYDDLEPGDGIDGQIEPGGSFSPPDLLDSLRRTYVCRRRNRVVPLITGAVYCECPDCDPELHGIAAPPSTNPEHA